MLRLWFYASLEGLCLCALVTNIEWLIKTTELSQVYNKNILRVMDVDSASSRSVQGLCKGQIVVRNNTSAKDRFANSLDLIKTSLGCRNLVLAPSHTTSGETSVLAPHTVAKRASSFEICLDKTLLNLGQAPLSQQMVPLSGDRSKTTFAPKWCCF